jgi:dihydroorotase
VLCFISAYLVGGLEGHLYPELYGPGQLDVRATAKVALEKCRSGARHQGACRNRRRLALGAGGHQARQADFARAGMPLYIHLGQLWPVKDGATVDADEVVRALMPLMEPGDVLAHPFTRHPGGFISEETGEVHPVVWAALERGVTVDVGHGSHFSFEMARKVIAAGLGRRHWAPTCTATTCGCRVWGMQRSVPKIRSSAWRRST